MHSQTDDIQLSEKGVLAASQTLGEEEIDLIDYFLVIWKRRKFILVVTIFLMIISGAISLAVPRRYITTAQIRIGRVWDKEIENPYIASGLIESDAFLARVIERLHLPTTPYKMKAEKSLEVSVVEGFASGQKIPIVLSLQSQSIDPQQGVDILNAVAQLLIESHQPLFEEKLKEYRAYEKDLEREVGRIAIEINILEELIRKQQLSPAANISSMIILQGQLEERNAQLLNFRKELKDVRINNTSSIMTNNTKLIAQPVLPQNFVSPQVKQKMAIAGAFGFASAIVFVFFLEFIRKVRLREQTK